MKDYLSMKSAHSLMSLVAGAAMLVAVPAFAQDANDTMAPATSAAPATAPAATPATAPAVQSKEVEAHIKKLHDQLMIKPAQEDAWAKVAQVMRDNASGMTTLMDERQGKGMMSAVDDLKSYQAIVQAHADGLKNLVDAFQPLYDAMPADQQKNADKVFGHHIDKKGKK